MGRRHGGCQEESVEAGRCIAETEELFRRYRRSVLLQATVILGNPETAKDVVQEVFLRVMSAHPEWIDVASTLAWLRRVTTNLCLNWRRDAERRTRILAGSSCPEREMPNTEPLVAGRALLSAIPEDLHEIGIYYFVGEMTQNEISELLGIPRRTVAHRLARFRAAALSVDLSPSRRRRRVSFGAPTAPAATRRSTSIHSGGALRVSPPS